MKFGSKSLAMLLVIVLLAATTAAIVLQTGKSQDIRGRAATYPPTSGCPANLGDTDCNLPPSVSGSLGCFLNGKTTPTFCCPGNAPVFNPSSNTCEVKHACPDPGTVFCYALPRTSGATRCSVTGGSDRWCCPPDKPMYDNSSQTCVVATDLPSCPAGVDCTGVTAQTLNNLRCESKGAGTVLWYCCKANTPAYNSSSNTCEAMRACPDPGTVFCNNVYVEDATHCSVAGGSDKWCCPPDKPAYNSSSNTCEAMRACPDPGTVFCNNVYVEDATHCSVAGGSDKWCCPPDKPAYNSSTNACVAASASTPTITPTPKHTTTTKRKPGDLNGDGKVDIYDYNLLVQNFGKTGSNIIGDINGDGKVDIFDYNILVGNYGK